MRGVKVCKLIGVYKMQASRKENIFKGQMSVFRELIFDIGGHQEQRKSKNKEFASSAKEKLH